MGSNNNGDNGYGPQMPGSNSEEQEEPQTVEEVAKKNLEAYTRFSRAVYLDIGTGGCNPNRTPEDVWKEYSLCTTCIHKSVCGIVPQAEKLLVVVDRCLEYLPKESDSLPPI